MGRILIVDESPAEIANLRAILDLQGWQCLTASTGAEALARAAADPPDLILLDLAMPDMDGFEACRQLQLNQRTRRIPVLFSSWRNDRADQTWAKLQGGRTLIAKPYASQQVLEAIRTYA